MKEKCINCGISGVPLYAGFDGHLHCERHIQMLVGAGQNVTKTNKEDKKNGSDHKQP